MNIENTRPTVLQLPVNNLRLGGENIVFVVEEGMAYWGDFEKALRMIRHAAESGTDAIEFQLFRADDFIVTSSAKYETLKSVELTDQQIIKLIGHAKTMGLQFIAAVLSPTMIDMLASSGCDAFNINASDVNNPSIIDAVVQSGLPFLISTPLASEKEIDWAVNRIMHKSTGQPQFGILHGQHTMFSSEGGIKLEETAIGYIANLKQKYKVPIGFIDHTPMIWMPSVAVAAGADMVTKHMAISREDRGPDWHICLEPHEMKESVDNAKRTKASMNTGIKHLSEDEQKDLLIMRKSIVASKTICTGRIIQRSDIQFKRPGTGIPPHEMDLIVGKRARRDILPDEMIDLEDFE